MSVNNSVHGIYQNGIVWPHVPYSTSPTEQKGLVVRRKTQYMYYPQKRPTTNWSVIGCGGKWEEVVDLFAHGAASREGRRAFCTGGMGL